MTARGTTSPSGSEIASASLSVLKTMMVVSVGPRPRVFLDDEAGGVVQRLHAGGGPVVGRGGFEPCLLCLPRPRAFGRHVPDVTRNAILWRA
jgi:hypothetical protein